MIIECRCDTLLSRTSVYAIISCSCIHVLKATPFLPPVVFREKEYTEAIVNMVGRGQAYGVYQFTYSHTNQIVPVDYDKIKAESFHKEMMELLNHILSLPNHQPSVYMAGTFDNFVQLIAQQHEQINCQ